MLDHPTCSMAPRYLNHLNKRIAIHEFCAFQVFFEDDDVLLSVQILKELIAAYPEGLPEVFVVVCLCFYSRFVIRR